MQPAAGTADTYFVDSPLLVAYGNLAIGKVCGVETLLSSSALIVFYSSILTAEIAATGWSPGLPRRSLPT